MKAGTRLRYWPQIHRQSSKTILLGLTHYEALSWRLLRDRVNHPTCDSTSKSSCSAHGFNTHGGSIVHPLPLVLEGCREVQRGTASGNNKLLVVAYANAAKDDIHRSTWYPIPPSCMAMTGHNWSGTIGRLSLFSMKQTDVIRHDAAPLGCDPDEWATFMSGPRRTSA